jgi:hypothetical protein
MMTPEHPVDKVAARRASSIAVNCGPASTDARLELEFHLISHGLSTRSFPASAAAR